MIQETMTHACRVCERTHIVKNGTNRCGNAQYHCKDCGIYRVLKPQPAYAESEPHTVLRACLERCRLRGGARILTIARQTVARWLKAHVQNLPDVKETLLPATPEDVLTLDAHLEFCAEARAQTLGVDSDVPPNAKDAWPSSSVTASLATCLRCWQEIPEGYKHCHTDHVIFGRPINTCSRLKPIVVLGRKLGRPCIWNGGTTPYASG